MRKKLPLETVIIGLSAAAAGEALARWTPLKKGKPSFWFALGAVTHLAWEFTGGNRWYIETRNPKLFPHGFLAKANGFLSTPYPKIGTPEGDRDLAQVIHQYTNRKVPEHLQDLADKRIDDLFEMYLASFNLSYDKDYYKQLRLATRPLIHRLKRHYNRPRPTETARRRGVSFSGDPLKTARSASYPSGHTIQAYVVAHKLGQEFPEHAPGLLHLAEAIAQSRIDRGVHFPSDVAFGRRIAKALVE